MMATSVSDHLMGGDSSPRPSTVTGSLIDSDAATSLTADEAFDAYYTAARRRGLKVFPKDGEDRDWRVYISRQAWDLIRAHWGWTGPEPTGQALLFGYPAGIGEDLCGSEIRIVERDAHP